MANVNTIYKEQVEALKNRVKYLLNWSMVDFSQLSHFVIFLGNPRSGTTLVRTIIDAHPNAVIGNEVHAMRYLQQGESWKQIVKRICLDHDKFNSHPFWTDYSYQIDTKGKKKWLKIIGDKRSLGTVKFFINDPTLIARFIKWSPLPIKVIRCVRHPLDVIATRHIRNTIDLDWNIEDYFLAEQNAEKLVNIFKRENTHHIFSEQLISQPEEELTQLLSFLDLEIHDAFIAACKNRIYPKANLSRTKAQWSDEQLQKVEQNMQALPHLKRYLENGKLIFKSQRIA